MPEPSQRYEGVLSSLSISPGKKEFTEMTPVIETEQRFSDLLSAYGIARSTIAGSPLNPSELRRTDAYWRACNYLALGMIYRSEEHTSELQSLRHLVCR